MWVGGITQHFYAYTWEILTLRGTGGYRLIVCTGQSEGLCCPSLLSLPLCSQVSNTSNEYRKLGLAAGFWRLHVGRSNTEMLLERILYRNQGVVWYLTVWRCQRQSKLVEFRCINIRDKNILYSFSAVTHPLPMHIDQKKGFLLSIKCFWILKKWRLCYCLSNIVCQDPSLSCVASGRFFLFLCNGWSLHYTSASAFYHLNSAHFCWHGSFKIFY